jgi:hypothetical protein
MLGDIAVINSSAWSGGGGNGYNSFFPTSGTENLFFLNDSFQTGSLAGSYCPQNSMGYCGVVFTPPGTIGTNAGGQMVLDAVSCSPYPHANLNFEFADAPVPNVVFLNTGNAPTGNPCGF